MMCTLTVFNVLVHFMHNTFVDVINVLYCLHFCVLVQLYHCKMLNIKCKMLRKLKHMNKLIN